MENLKQFVSALKEWATTTAKKLVQTLKQGTERTLLEARLQLLTGLTKSFGVVKVKVLSVLLRVKNRLSVLVARTERKLKDNDDK
jgi:hypothetical protein